MAYTSVTEPQAEGRADSKCRMTTEVLAAKHPAGLHPIGVDTGPNAPCKRNMLRSVHIVHFFYPMTLEATLHSSQPGVP